MLQFSNQELAIANHVSVRTVRNWIESAKAGKLDLSLITKGERTYVANTSKNLQIIQGLVDKGKKYRPHRSQRTVTPQENFYELYSQEQLYDIVTNLEINHEIPCQYNYFGIGANNWANYMRHMDEEETPNNLNATAKLLASNSEYIDNLLANYDQINVVDIGAGNAQPVKDFLAHLLDKGKLGRYIAIDISQTMLKVAEANVKKWFNGKVNFEGHTLNVEHDRFGYLLANEYIKSDAQRTTNLIMFFGGTIQNFKNPGSILKVIHDSMGINDFFLHEQKLDTSSSRKYFDFNPNPAGARLAPLFRYIFDLLNIDETLYDVDMGFDPIESERYIRVVLNVALSLKFKFKGGERTIYFDKGDTIQLWRARQNTALQIVALLMHNELYPLQVSQTTDQEFVLTISRIKHG